MEKLFQDYLREYLDIESLVVEYCDATHIVAIISYRYESYKESIAVNVWDVLLWMYNKQNPATIIKN